MGSEESKTNKEYSSMKRFVNKARIDKKLCYDDRGKFITKRSMRKMCIDKMNYRKVKPMYTDSKFRRMVSNTSKKKITQCSIYS